MPLAADKNRNIFAGYWAQHKLRILKIEGCIRYVWLNIVTLSCASVAVQTFRGLSNSAHALSGGGKGGLKIVFFSVHTVWMNA